MQVRIAEEAGPSELLAAACEAAQRTPAPPPLTCRPISKRKCWKITEVLQRAKVLDASLLQRAHHQRQQQQKEEAGSFAASAVSPP